MTELQELQMKIKQLEEENRYLKNLLKSSGIIDFDKNNLIKQDYETIQCIKTEFTERDANHFFSMFWGRTDVYSQRTISKSTGIANYYPQCYNFWKNGCPKQFDKKKKCADCKMAAFIPLGKKQIISHLKGLKEDGTDVIGVYPLFSDDTCRFIVFDFDDHDQSKKTNTFDQKNTQWQEEVNALRKICDLNGIDCLVERSRSGNGAHVWIFFEKRIAASTARKFGNALLKKA